MMIICGYGKGWLIDHILQEISLGRLEIRLDIETGPTTVRLGRGRHIYAC